MIFKCEITIKRSAAAAERLRYVSSNLVSCCKTARKISIWKGLQ